MRWECQCWVLYYHLKCIVATFPQAKHANNKLSKADGEVI